MYKVIVRYLLGSEITPVDLGIRLWGVNAYPELDVLIEHMQVLPLHVIKQDTTNKQM